jgi:hypothetical protein
MTVVPRLPHAHTHLQTAVIPRRSGSTLLRHSAVTPHRRNAPILRHRNSSALTPRRAPRIRHLHTLRRLLAEGRRGRPEGGTLQVVAVVETEVALDRTAVKSQLHI